MKCCLKSIILSLLLYIPVTASSALERTSLLPADAQTYVRVSSTTNFWSRFKLSPLGRLWADQQFQGFLGNPDAKTWQDLFLEGESDAESEVLIEQLKMLKGEIILAFDIKMAIRDRQKLIP
jgi:hypothetical protein